MLYLLLSLGFAGDIGFQIELFNGSSVLDSEHWDFFEFKRWKLYHNPEAFGEHKSPVKPSRNVPSSIAPRRDTAFLGCCIAEGAGLLETIKAMWPEDHEDELNKLLSQA